MADRNVEQMTEDRDVLGWPRPNEFRRYEDWVKGNSPEGSFGQRLEKSLARGVQSTGVTKSKP